MGSISQAFKQDMDIPSNIGSLSYSYGTRHIAKNETVSNIGSSIIFLLE